MKQPNIFRDFDLPTMHLEDMKHFVTPKSRDPYEIARRRELPKGVLAYEQQRKGLLVAQTALQSIDDPFNLNFAAELLAASTINSAWYVLARGAPVMRRRLKLPILAGDDADYSLDRQAIRRGAVGELSNATSQADVHLAMLHYRHEHAKKAQFRLGQIIGNAGLTLACVGIGEVQLLEMAELRADKVQNRVRRRGLLALHHAQILTDQLGTAPSLAQLASPDSDLAVHWRRNAPEQAFSALEAAMAA
jgi:hypothetical protein